jgi:hypothetical protein
LTLANDAMGHKRTWRGEFAMSALPPKDGVIGRRGSPGVAG